MNESFKIASVFINQKGEMKRNCKKTVGFILTCQ